MSFVSSLNPVAVRSYHPLGANASLASRNCHTTSRVAKTVQSSYTFAPSLTPVATTPRAPLTPSTSTPRASHTPRTQPSTPLACLTPSSATPRAMLTPRTQPSTPRVAYTPTAATPRAELTPRAEASTPRALLTPRATTPRAELTPKAEPLTPLAVLTPVALVRRGSLTPTASTPKAALTPVAAPSTPLAAMTPVAAPSTPKVTVITTPSTPVAPRTPKTPIIVASATVSALARVLHRNEGPSHNRQASAPIPLPQVPVQSHIRNYSHEIIKARLPRPPMPQLPRDAGAYVKKIRDSIELATAPRLPANLRPITPPSRPTTPPPSSPPQTLRNRTRVLRNPRSLSPLRIPTSDNRGTIVPIPPRPRGILKPTRVAPVLSSQSEIDEQVPLNVVPQYRGEVTAANNARYVERLPKRLQVYIFRGTTKFNPAEENYVPAFFEDPQATTEVLLGHARLLDHANHVVAPRLKRAAEREAQSTIAEQASHTRTVQFSETVLRDHYEPQDDDSVEQV